MRKTTLFLAVAFVVAAFSSGCALAHRYPAYRGKVLELGTDKPIEGAGVLAVYDMTVYYWIERNSEYVGYQAVLTDKEGKFTVPAKFFFAFRPLASFDNKVRITIYKKGYGNFPGSIGGEYTVKRAKQGKTEPALERGDWIPPEKEVTIWLPKLETEAEIRDHDRLITIMIPGDDLPPKGITREQFNNLFGGY
ncbi:MAG: transthyretin-like family protein [Desulfobacteria bacterium]